ncbi:MAG: HEAT repeat domain-containing protein [Planctomycetota bacterium]
MRSKYLPLASLALLGACGAAPDPVYDPNAADRIRQQEAQGEELRKRQADFDRVLLDLDKSLDQYFSATMNSGFDRADRLSESLERFIREKVAENFDQLVVLADGRQGGQIDPVAAGVSRQLADEMQVAVSTVERNRQIAMAALGFSGRTEALDPLINGAASSDEKIACNAVLGLAILGDQRTPPEVIVRVMDNKKFSDMVRSSAAWSLYSLEAKVIDSKPIQAVWARVLSNPIDDESLDGVLISALRGAGLSRNKEFTPEVMRYTAHPTPLVRMSAAIALGRLKDTSSVEALLNLIETSEQNANVRLAARKALQALAGGNDRGYDVKAWRELFQRGS